MKKRGIIILIFLLSLSFVSAVSVSLSSNSASISSASDLYAYEVSMTYTGTPSDAVFNGFLGAGTSSGYNLRGDYLYVYESKLDSAKVGVSGSGSLFNVTTTGGTTLYSVLLINSTGDEEVITYYCGDGTCGGHEDCSSCPTDCGQCPGGGGGLSTSGTGSTATVSTALPDLAVSPNEFSISAILNEPGQREFTIKNDGDKTYTLELEVENLEGVLTLDSDSLTLYPGEEKNIRMNVLVFAKGFYVGNVLVKESGRTVFEVPIIVNVRSEDFLFDVSISVAEEFRVIELGGGLVSEINLLQVGPQEKIDVIANYIIKDFEGNSYLEETETFYVLGEKKVVKGFGTEILPAGKYVLGVEIVYPGAFAISSTQFSIVEKPKVSLDIFKDWRFLLVVFLGSWVLILFFVIVLVFVRRKKHGR